MSATMVEAGCTTGIEGYRAYLAERDGEADPTHRRLANREQFFAGLEANPIRSTREVDRDVFVRNLHRRRPEPGLDRVMLFLLATAKLNQAERFGVALGDTYGRVEFDTLPPERVYIALEEHYRTRLLTYVVEMFGLPFQTVVPPLLMRQFVRANVFAPERFGFPFVGAGEMAGCVLFDELRRVGLELFADEPDVSARVDRLYREILTDELGHVGYCAARSGNAGRAVMRRFFPRVGRLLARQTAEIRLLVDPAQLHARLDRPFDFDELKAGLSPEPYVCAVP